MSEAGLRMEERRPLHVILWNKEKECSKNRDRVRDKKEIANLVKRGRYREKEKEWEKHRK